jgi:hypothetical protein
LKAEWERVFGHPPPLYLRRAMFLLAINYRRQEQAHGGLRPETIRQLVKAAAEAVPGEKAKPATTGVDGPDEAVKYLLAGADIVMTASALLRHGPAHIGTIVRGIEAWLAERGFASVDEARGRLSGQRLADPEAMVRAQYIKILTGYR